jgi:hypothetical protein
MKQIEISVHKVFPVFLKFLFIYSHVHTLIGPFFPATPCCLPLHPNPPCFQVESVLPLSLILLKRKPKQ